MDKPSSSRLTRKSAAGRRTRLVPSTLRPRGVAPPPAQPGPPNTGVSQPPEMFRGNLYANIIRETMGRWNRARNVAERREESSEQTQNSTSSSSSLRFSDGQSFDEIADEIIQEMQGEEKEERSGETQELREPARVIVEEKNRPPQEDPIREIPDFTRAKEEDKKELDDWKTHVEDTLDQLLMENAALNERLRAPKELTNQLFGIVERMMSGRGEGTEASRQPLPLNSSTSQIQPSRFNTEVHLTEGSRKRRPSITISQPTSAAKKTRKSGSKGGQGRD